MTVVAGKVFKKDGRQLEELAMKTRTCKRVACGLRGSPNGVDGREVEKRRVMFDFTSLEQHH